MSPFFTESGKPIPYPDGQVRSDDTTPFRPAAGILVGVTLGTAIWTAIILLVWLATR